MSDSLIDQVIAFAQGNNPYIIRHGQMNDLNFIEDKKGYQDFVEHRLYEPVEPKTLDKIKQFYPDVPDLLTQLYQKSNGASFFAYSHLPQNELGGFFFLPMEAWKGEEVKDLISWISMTDDDYELDDETEDGSLELYGIPPWVDDILVLGGFEASPERFYMPTTGELAGNVLMFEHDEYRNHRIAENFEQFLSLLINHPSDLMNHCGGNFYYDMIGYGNNQNYIPLSKDLYEARMFYEGDDEDEE